jgi:acyl carrier protein
VNKQDTLSKLQEIVQDITGDDETKLTLNTVAEDVDNWDSINHIKIILAVESEFDVSFEADEVGSIKGVRSLVDLIAAKL